MQRAALPPDSWTGRLKQVFSIDLRSLALFRVLLGMLVLCDLGWRAGDIHRLYTDAGVLPRAVAWSLDSPWQWSLHAASGTALWQVMLFALAAGAAVALILGYRSRLMAGLTFVLLASLLNRNAWVLHGGDQLLVVMSFWSLFLPLGARCSVDAALQVTNEHAPDRRNDTPRACYSVATFAVVVQVLSLYIFTALLKTGAAWRVHFDAALYAVSLQHYATAVGHWIREFPGFLRVATAYVLLVEFLAPLLVVLPVSSHRVSGWRALFAWPQTRIIGLLLLASLHIAFLLMLHIGLFPLIDLMALSLLIPGSVWETPGVRQLIARFQALGFSVARHRYALDRFSASRLPYRRQSLKPTLAGQCVALFCLYVITAYNLTGLPALQHWRPEHVTVAAMTLRINQHWDMFAPYPLRRSMYPQIRGTLRNGEPVNLYPLTQPSTDWAPPVLTNQLFENYRWRKYYSHIRQHRDNALRRALGSYLCRTWNHAGLETAEQLATLEILFTTRVTRTDGTVAKDSQRRVWRHWCFAEFADPDF